MEVQVLPDQDLHLVLSGGSEGSVQLWKGLDGTEIDLMEVEVDDGPVTMKTHAQETEPVPENLPQPPKAPIVPKPSLPKASPFAAPVESLPDVEDTPELPPLTPAVKWNEDEQDDLFESLASAVW